VPINIRTKASLLDITLRYFKAGTDVVHTTYQHCMIEKFKNCRLHCTYHHHPENGDCIVCQTLEQF